MASPQSEIVVRHINNPSKEEIARMVWIATRAFSNASAEDDAFLQFVFQGKDDIERLLPLLNRALIGAAAVEGEIFVAGLEGQDFSSVAVWTAPGQPWMSDEQAEAGYKELMGKLSLEAQRWWREWFRPHHSALRKTALGDRAKNGWYLHLLSTDPAYQRRGLATALMKSAEDKAAAGSSLNFETYTDANRKFYERLGYRVPVMGNRELSMRLENVEGNKNPLDAKCDGWCMEKIKV